MDEKRLEDKIYEEAKQYEIKTSSIDILEKYNKQKKPNEIDKKKSIPWWKSKPFRYGITAFSILALAAGITTTILFTSPSSPIIPHSTSQTIVTPIIPPSNNSILNQASYEIIAGSSILTSNETNTYNKVLGLKQRSRHLKINNEASSLSLKTAIKAFDTYSPMVINMEKAIFNNSYYVAIESDNQNYKYAIKIQDNFILYYNDSLQETKEDETTTSIDAKLKDLNENKTYDVKIEKEVEKEVDEIETSLKTTIYYTSSHYIVIEKSNEVEVDETEDSYELKEYKDSKEPILDLSFELETENQETERTFKIEKAPNLFYSYEYQLLNFSFSDTTSFTIIYDSYSVLYNNGVYTYNGEEILD